MNRDVLLTVIEVLSSPRDRYRRPEVDWHTREKVRALLLKHNGNHNIGALDTVDQCLILLQIEAGVPVKSVLEK